MARDHRIFVNISNHPSAKWGTMQMEAAQGFAPKIMDIPFPRVPPTADEDEIEALAGQVVDSLPEGVSHAMISGEYVLTFSLVSRLQAQGIACMAATTERIVAKDEEGKKVSTFQFVHFRRYPTLSTSQS